MPGPEVCDVPRDAQLPRALGTRAGDGAANATGDCGRSRVAQTATGREIALQAKELTALGRRRFRTKYKHLHSRNTVKRQDAIPGIPKT